MKVIGIIPARFGSTRFPGKPIADICGRPMIWWVYRQAKKVARLDDVVIATDDERIASVCEKYAMPYMITSSNHATVTSRIHEVASRTEADLYLVINGDEPLISEKIIEAVIPETLPEQKYYVGK